MLMNSSIDTHVNLETSPARLMDLYRCMFMARCLDEAEEDLIARGEAFFSVSGAGHEGTAVFHPYLGDTDWLHCHYRDKALMLARGITPLMFFRSVLCKGTSHSAGRQMSAHMSDPERRILSIVGPVGNHALQAVGLAAAIKQEPEQPLVVCAMGDGTTQQGEVLEAIGEAVRRTLPVLFLIENNEFSISTKTNGHTFYSFPQPHFPPDSFYGLPLHYVEGWEVVKSSGIVGPIVQSIRQDRHPALVVFHVKRLTNHTTADQQLVYRSEAEVEAAKEYGDPLRRFKQHLLEQGITEHEFTRLEQDVHEEVHRACEIAMNEADPSPMASAKKPLPPALLDPGCEYRGTGKGPRYTMKEALREVLAYRLNTDPRVCLYGEDIEDPKGDVFGVTHGLSRQWPDRVRNSPLAEATIIGTSIGQALAGNRPVAFLQFADFLPLAFNQIISELGSMYWRTNGGWDCPVVVMITCGGYRPGLGPFHAQTFESISTHVPGVDVMMPSTASDAAGLLNTAFESGRPTLFFYPKSCLNDPTQTTSTDVQRQRVPLGQARVVQEGTELTLVTWGNCVALGCKVAEAMHDIGVRLEVIDLRCLSPWDTATVRRSAEKTGHLLVVHEDNLTCGFGAEVLSTVAEQSAQPIHMRRLTRPDTYVPCHFASQLAILPSFVSILTAVAEMLDVDLQWESGPETDPTLYVVEAFGSSPSDEEMVVVEWKVHEGDTVEEGQILVQLEASKAIFDVASPVAGVVADLRIPENDVVTVGDALLHIRTTGTHTREKSQPKEVHGLPLLTRRSGDPTPKTSTGSAGPSGSRSSTPVLLSSVAIAKGKQCVPNADLLQRFPGLTSDDIIQRTGIAQRYWVANGETALTLALEATRNLLNRENLLPEHLNLIVCSTGTPIHCTPSMACLLLGELTPAHIPLSIQAYDLNAACSGYLYALQAGYDFLQSEPDANVLIVTTEVLSTRLQPDDFSTRILFGDAASASLLRGGHDSHTGTVRVQRPFLSAKGDVDLSICVPATTRDEPVTMHGKKVFAEAVKAMSLALEHSCQEAGLTLGDLAIVIPHQANQRILDAVGRRLNLPTDKIFSNIRDVGNTSSNTIPLSLYQNLPRSRSGDRIGLCAFGGGFTYGATILEIL